MFVGFLPRCARLRVDGKNSLAHNEHPPSARAKKNNRSFFICIRADTLSLALYRLRKSIKRDDSRNSTSQRFKLTRSSDYATVDNVNPIIGAKSFSRIAFRRTPGAGNKRSRLTNTGHCSTSTLSNDAITRIFFKARERERERGWRRIGGARQRVTM